MADGFGLSDVSSEDTGKGKQLKTGNLKRSYNMPKGQKGKLSYKSLSACLESAKTDSDSTACNKYFEGSAEQISKSKKKDEWYMPKEPGDRPMNKEESKIWSKYISKGGLVKHYLDKNEKAILDSLIERKLKKLEKVPKKQKK